MPKSLQLKRLEAATRKVASDKHTVKGRIAILDARLGAGKGAKRERAICASLDFSKPIFKVSENQVGY